MKQYCLGQRHGKNRYTLSDHMEHDLAIWNGREKELTKKHIERLPFTKRGKIRDQDHYEHGPSDNKHRLWRENKMMGRLKTVRRQIKRLVRSSKGEISVRVPLPYPPSEDQRNRRKASAVRNLEPYTIFCKTLWGRVKDHLKVRNQTAQLPKAGYAAVCSEVWKNLTDMDKKSPVEALGAMTDETILKILGIRQTTPKRQPGRRAKPTAAA